MDDPLVTIKVCDVSVSLGNARLLEGVSFQCYEGEWTLICGPTGAGKSTLLRAINGLCVPRHGQIWALGSKIPGRSHREARAVWRQTGTVLQEVALFETKTARENVELGLRAAGVDGRSARAQATQWLERLNLNGKGNEYQASLSGGERQRVALARAFAIHPRLLILDEPTSALDRATARVVLLAVRELVEQGCTVVMSSHRVEEIEEMCDQVISLCQGCLSNVERLRPAKKRVVTPEMTVRTMPRPGRIGQGRLKNSLSE